MEHEDCGALDVYCVEAPDNLGGTRQCMKQDEIGEYFGCYSGELIIMPDEPWHLSCY